MSSPPSSPERTRLLLRIEERLAADAGAGFVPDLAWLAELPTDQLDALALGLAGQPVIDLAGPLCAECQADPDQPPPPSCQSCPSKPPAL